MNRAPPEARQVRVVETAKTPPSLVETGSGNSLLLGDQFIPRAPHRFSQSRRRRHQNVGLAGFDALERAKVQIGPLRHFFLRQLAGHPRAPEIGAEGA